MVLGSASGVATVGFINVGVNFALYGELTLIREHAISLGELFCFVLALCTFFGGRPALLRLGKYLSLLMNGLNCFNDGNVPDSMNLLTYTSFQSAGG